MLKRVLIMAVLFLCSFSAVIMAAIDEDVDPQIKDSIVLAVDSSKVYVNGKLGRINDHDLNQVPFVENGHTLVPLRFISEQLGAKISWNQANQEISIDVNGKRATMRLGDTSIRIDDQEIKLTISSRTINGTTYLPLRTVVEDLLQKKLFYKNGIIIISDEAKTISDLTLAQLEKRLKPRLVYSSGLELYYIYSDGSSYKEDLGFSDQLKRTGMIRTTDVGEGSFYVTDHNNYTSGYKYVHKINLEGTRTKTIEIDGNDPIFFILAKDGQQYYYGDGKIVQISDDDEDSARKIIGPGYLSKDHTYIQGDQIWFTDYSGDHAIYRLHNGKKTKLTDDNSFMQHVLDDWIYYTYFENKRWALYRINKDGGKKTKLSADSDVQDSFISNNKIYYLDNRSKTLRVMNLDGSGNKAIGKLDKSGVKIFAVDQGYIYYTEENQDGNWTQTLNKVKISNGAKQTLVEVPLDFSHYWERIKNVRLLGDYIYYTIKNQIFAVKSDGSNVKELARLFGQSNGILSLEDR